MSLRLPELRKRPLVAARRTRGTSVVVADARPGPICSTPWARKLESVNSGPLWQLTQRALV